MVSQKLADYSQLQVTGNIDVFFEKRIENDGSGNPLYVGYNKAPNASTSATTWYIVKFSYSGGYVVRAQLPDNGPTFSYAWDSRATYFT